MPKPDSLIERLFHYEETNPTHEAIVTPAITLSYAQLSALVRLQVLKFYDAGIPQNSIIGIKCTDDAQHLVLCLAATYMGATSFTIPAHETESMQQAIINRCGATHVVDDHHAVDLISANSPVKSALEAQPVARLLFSTSGTTGEAKLVVHQDNDLVAQAHRHVNSAQERFLCLASMQHNFAKRHRLYCVAMGATNIFVDVGQESLVAQCLILKVNVMHVSAFQAQELLAAPDISKLSHIRLKLGGSHVPLSLRQQLRDTITHNLQAGYGTTETGAIGFTDPEDANAGESVGQPLPGIEIRTVSPQGTPQGSGEHGELIVRCEGMFRGYFNRPDLTETRIKDGWFHTGDIGYLDQQHRIFLCGRSDDMFLFNSINIFPQDIESQMCQHPNVSDAALLPKASSVHGNIPVALVVFANKDKTDLLTLEKFIKNRVGIRAPRQITVVNKIPRNASGKIARSAAIKLLTRSNKIRSSIIHAIGEEASDYLKPSLIEAFENNDKDIDLNKLELDSLARMELLIALETDFDTVITPQEFSQFRSLGDIVSRVLSPPTENELNQESFPLDVDSNPVVTESSNMPHVVKLFRRIFRFCPTVAHLNKALTTLEDRLTPLEVSYLRESHLGGQLIPSAVAKKFHAAMTLWLQDLSRMMLDSGKQTPEPFSFHRINPNVTHFIGPGSSTDKILLVCFSERGGRRLMMPNAVLLQHTDSRCYDLLIIAEPISEGYMHGVPGLGNNMTEVSQWIARLDLINNYSSIRTMGCSAGGYAAVVAGYILGAEIAVCIGGRFHAERYLLKNLDKFYSTWRSVLNGHCSRVLLIYPTDNRRDSKYARFIARLTGGSLVGIEFSNDQVGHYILRRLVERGELAPYLADTIFAGEDNELITAHRANVIMSFPDIQIRNYG